MVHTFSLRRSVHFSTRLALSTTLLLLFVLLLVPASRADHHKGGADLVDVAVEAGAFKTLVAAVQAAGLVDTLKGEGPFTVFAPTDAAFAKLPAGTVEDLLKPENRARLQAILTYHVVAGAVPARQAVQLDRAATVNGQEVGITFAKGRLRVGGAAVVDTDIEASNGIIHVIDAVLLPPEEKVGEVGARELISLAITRGVPLYNHGQRAACAAIYEVAARGLLGWGEEIPEVSQQRLTTALAEIGESKDAGDRAWILRRALDDVAAQLGGAMRMSAR